MENYHENKPYHLKRILWFCINHSIFRLCSIGGLRGAGTLLLKLFGASIGHKTMVYGTADIFAPWNLNVGSHSCIGPHTKIYNKAPIQIGHHTIISQGSYLCTASHNYSSINFDLITNPIVVGSDVWICTDAYIGMGVNVGDGAIVGARAAVFKDVGPWTIVGGNPAVFLKKREPVSDRRQIML